MIVIDASVRTHEERRTDPDEAEYPKIERHCQMQGLWISKII
jgi:hypothetical protein